MDCFMRIVCPRSEKCFMTIEQSVMLKQTGRNALSLALQEDLLLSKPQPQKMGSASKLHCSQDGNVHD
jgi:hypothetical protein